MSVAKPFIYTILLAGQDASQDLREFGASITYTDNAESEADTIEIAMGDPDGRWRDEWYPDPGMTVEFSVRYEGESGGITPVEFEIDNPKFSSRAGGSGGKKVRLRGKTVPISLKLNTKGSEEFEEQTLSAIASKIASDLGLELIGEFEEITLKRVTREDETPLEFLKRLSEKYGHWFKIESKTKLVFYSKKALDSQESAFTLTEADTENLEWGLDSTEKYSQARVKYTNPESGETIEVEVEAEEEIESENVLEINEAVQDEAEAKIVAQEKLRRANAGQVKLELKAIGNPLILAGVMFELRDIGRDSGKYLIKKATHTLDSQGGWKTSCSAEKK